MDTGNFISQLRDIRGNLVEAVRMADNFEYKLVGPRPSPETPGGVSKSTAESVATLLSDIAALSLRLPKMLSHQHEIVGEFQPADECLAAKPARYA